MKSITYLFLLVALPAVAFAQMGVRANEGREWHRNDEASALSVYSETGEPFLLILNGISQNSMPTGKIRVEGLPQFSNDIEIIFTDNRTPAIHRHINVADPLEGRAVSMVLKIVRERDGDVRLRFKKCSEIDHDYRAPGDEYVMMYGSRQQINRNVVVNTPPPPPPPPAGPVAMDAMSFEDAKSSIAAASFDDTKLSTAKTIIAGNYLTTDQVMQICNLFSFDQSKMRFAKAAYARTVDNVNYFKVGNAFSFDSYREELNSFISKQHH